MKKQNIHWNLSIKEFMLFAGILVAIIILFAFWLNPPTDYSNIEIPLLPLPVIEFPSSDKVLTEITETILQSLR